MQGRYGVSVKTEKEKRTKINRKALPFAPKTPL
jgi:hypothetical protein